MTSAFLIVISMGATSWQQRGDVEYCRTLDGYRIVRSINAEDASFFSESRISARLASQLCQLNEECYRILSADPYLSDPGLRPTAIRSWFDPTHPFAYLFEIRGNAFYVYTVEEQASWVTVRGRNLFQDSPLGESLLFYGMSFSAFNGPLCQDGFRRLSFVHPGLSIESLDRIVETLEYFEHFFADPSRLIVSIYSSFELADVHRGMNFAFPPPQILRAGVPREAMTASVSRTKTGRITLSIRKEDDYLLHRTYQR